MSTFIIMLGFFNILNVSLRTLGRVGRGRGAGRALTARGRAPRMRRAPHSPLSPGGCDAAGRLPHILPHVRAAMDALDRVV